MQTRLAFRVCLLACLLFLSFAVTALRAQQGQAELTDSTKSEIGGNPVMLTFDNKTDLTLNINWIDEAGVEVFDQRGVMAPYESRVVGQGPGKSVFIVRIDDPQCEPLKRVEVGKYQVKDEPGDQTLTVKPEKITEGLRQQAESHSGC